MPNTDYLSANRYLDTEPITQLYLSVSDIKTSYNLDTETIGKSCY
jgi:hypothetical protein